MICKRRQGRSSLGQKPTKVLTQIHGCLSCITQDFARAIQQEKKTLIQALFCKKKEKKKKKKTEMQHK